MDNQQLATEEEFKQRLLELGLLTRITPPLAPGAVPRDRQPVPVPISELIIRDRR
jgi:hypothetical protein